MPVFKIYYGAPAPIVARGVHQVSILAFAAQATVWHAFPREASRRRAMRTLALRGALETDNGARMYRFTYPKA